MDIDDLESSMALDSIVIPELPISNSRAGLYIYLNASVWTTIMISRNLLLIKTSLSDGRS